MKTELPAFPAAQPLRGQARWNHLRAVFRIVVISVLISEVVTFVLLQLLLDQVMIEGQIIALVCAGPISAWIADRQLRMRRTIAVQRDRLVDVNGELKVRNAELDAFARAVAHDLKNPLAAVIGFAHYLEHVPDIKAADTEDAIPTILEAGERAVEIIDSLLLLHGIRQTDPAVAGVNSNEVVESTLQALSRPIAEKKAVVRRTGDFPKVSAYAPWLAAMLENLISNAVKYGGSPPTIELSSLQTSDGMVRFQVRDHGSGVPIEDHDRIFDEFEQISPTGADGHGLGLAIVRRIADRLGGEAGLDNPPDGGALFWFTVPAA